MNTPTTNPYRIVVGFFTAPAPALRTLMMPTTLHQLCYLQQPDRPPGVLLAVFSQAWSPKSTELCLQMTATAESPLYEPAWRFCDVGGVRLHRVSLTDAITALDRFIDSGRPHQVVTVNLDFLRLAHRDAQFRQVLNSADLAVADGMPVVWLSRTAGDPLPARVTGVDLTLHAAELAARKGYSIFLLGAAPAVAERAAAALVRSHPGLRQPGVFSPPMGVWSDREQCDIVERVRAAKPDMLFVALGAPRQDLWLRERLQELNVPVCAGIGGSLDIIAGNVSRAPAWMQSVGLEWTHRLMCEPRRLARRYLLEDLPFLVTALTRRAPDAAGQPRI